MTEAVRLLDCVATQGRDTASQVMTRRWAGALGTQQARGACRRHGRAGAAGARGRQAGAREARRARQGRSRRVERGRGARLKSYLTRLHPNLGLALSNNKINK